MTLDARLEQLSKKHQALETEIHEELRHPAFDDDRLVLLKRQKLKVKDEIHRLQLRRWHA
ncbi:MAG: DUF465 domain-containing protein [Pseudomonadota bacterium]